MGALSDSIQIQIPPGRRSLEPRLTLSYNSLSGYSLAGQGWSISTGSVERWRGDGTPSVRAVAEGTVDDRYSYSLSGAGGELHDQNGDGVYRARIESVYRPFLRVGDGWVMTDGVGGSYRFGTSAENRIDDELWLLEQVQDLSGNSINYHYGTECEIAPPGFICDATNHRLYPREIRYTGHMPSGDPGSNTVNFNYEPRPDERVSYRRGVREAESLRLSAISVYARGDLVRRYRLEYQNEDGGSSQLLRVTLVGADDATQMVLREVDYSERPRGWPLPINASFPLDLVDADGKSTGVLFADVNGDGYADQVGSSGVYLGTGSGGYAHSLLWSNSLDAADVQFVDDSGIDTGVRLIDVNADARPDIFIATQQRSEIWTNTGAGWLLDTAWSASLAGISGLNIALTDPNATTNCLAPACSSYGESPPSGCSPDFCTGADTDAADCLESCTGSEDDPEDCIPADAQFCAAPNFSEQGTETFALIGEDGESRGVEFADVNGDGRIDIVWSLKYDQTTFLTESPRIVRAVLLNGGVDNPGWHSSNQLSTALGSVLSNQGGAAGAFVVENFYEGYSLLDVNGDGLADILRSIESKQAVYLGTGSGWVFSDTHTNSLQDNGIFALDEDRKSQGLLLTEFNDDGLVDYIQALETDAGIEYQAYRNTGFGWQQDPAMREALAATALSFVSSDGNATGVTITDVDGDGIGDLVSANPDSADAIRLSTGVRSGLVERSVNTFGQITEVTWGSSRGFDHLTEAGIQGMPVAMQVVLSLQRNNGLGPLQTVSYSYAGGLYTSKGYRGFQRFRETPNAGLGRTVLYYQDESRTAQPREISTYDSNGMRRSHSESETVVVNAETGVQQVLLGETLTSRFNAAGQLTTSSLVKREYNAFMQATSILADQQLEVHGDENQIFFEWQNDVQSGLWGLMRSVHEASMEGETLSRSEIIYNARGLPTEQREWVSGSHWVSNLLAYDAFGNVSTETDRNGNTTSFAYDPETNTRRIQATDPLGRVTRSLYDHRFGTLVEDTDANGNSVTTSYGPLGEKTRVVQPGDELSPYGTATFEYGHIGDPTAQYFRTLRTENAGTTDVFETLFLFDAAGRIYEERQEGANGIDIVATTEYGVDGQVLTASLPFFDGYAGDFFHSTRDDLGRLTSITDPLGQSAHLSYDGFQVSTLDARGNETRTKVNYAGKLLEVEVDVGGESQLTRYAYTLGGHLHQVIDALGNTTTIDYDGLGRRAHLDDPNIGTFSYRYDGEGRMIERIGPDSSSLRIVYSNAGELLEKHLPDGKKQTFHYGSSPARNENGRLIRIEDDAGSLHIHYDARGRVSERRRKIAGNTYVTGYTYDSMDRLRSVVYPDGFVVNYHYDRGSNLSSISDSTGKTIADGIEYNASGRIERFRFGNEVSTEYQYDRLARMLSARSTDGHGFSLQELSYAYDSANNVLSFSDAASGDDQEFEYDELNRLVQARGRYGEEQYRFDAIGNLVQKGNLRFTHDEVHPHRVVCAVEIGAPPKQAGKGNQHDAIDNDCANAVEGLAPESLFRSFAIDYDSRGNMISKGEQQFEYDGENRLVRSRELPTNKFGERIYDWSGNIVVTADRSESTIYIDGLYEEGKTHVSKHIRAGDLLVATIKTPKASTSLIASAHSPTNMIQAAIGWPSGVLLLMTLGCFCRKRIAAAIGALVGATRSSPGVVITCLLVAFSCWANSGYVQAADKSKNEQRYYYHSNQLDSVNIVTGDRGEVISRRDYKPYGEPVEWSGSQSGPREILNTFQGKEYDENSGMYDFSARFYDPELGRFTSADTIVTELNDPRTLNRYAFQGGNPITYVDPSGRGFFSAIGDFFVGLGGALEAAGQWIVDHAAEIITVVIIVVVVVVVVAAVILTGGLAAVGFAGIAAWAALGAAAGFAIFGGIALAQGYTYQDVEFWLAAGTGALLGGLVGAALPVAFAPSTFFAGGITTVAGKLAAGTLIGAATGGLFEALACIAGCGGVENLYMNVATGIIIGAVTGFLTAGLSIRLARINPKHGFVRRWTRKIVAKVAMPGRSGFVLKTSTTIISVVRFIGANGVNSGGAPYTGLSSFVLYSALGTVALVNWGVEEAGWGTPPGVVENQLNEIVESDKIF